MSTSFSALMDLYAPGKIAVEGPNLEAIEQPPVVTQVKFEFADPSQISRDQMYENEIDEIPDDFEECSRARDRINEMRSVFNDYNEQMSIFLENNPNPWWQKCVRFAYEKYIKRFLLKEHQVRKLEIHKKQLELTITNYEKAHEISLTCPDLFVKATDIKSTIERIRDELIDLNMKVIQLKDEIGKAQHYQRSKKYPKRALLRMQVYYARLCWQKGERPQNFQKNCEYIDKNFDNFPNEKCTDCDNQIFNLKVIPIYDFGRFVHMPNNLYEKLHNIDQIEYWQIICHFPVTQVQRLAAY